MCILWKHTWKRKIFLHTTFAGHTGGRALKLEGVISDRHRPATFHKACLSSSAVRWQQIRRKLLAYSSPLFYFTKIVSHNSLVWIPLFMAGHMLSTTPWLCSWSPQTHGPLSSQTKVSEHCRRSSTRTRTPQALKFLASFLYYIRLEYLWCASYLSVHFKNLSLALDKCFHFLAKGKAN